MVINDNKMAGFPAKFCCISCDYFTSKKHNLVEHNKTIKHKKVLEMVINGNNDNKMAGFPAPDHNQFVCECGRVYKYNSGLSRHKKTCYFVSKTPKLEDPDPSDKQLMLMILKENSELKHLILDVCKKESSINLQNQCNNTNSHNKFNLNFFLNETCKDAMNIMDFVDSIQLQLSDLEKVGEIGYVNGISNIIVKHLKELDVTKRPVHCTDKKREVMYIKDEDKWEKEDDENKKIRKVIKKIANKNIRLLQKFKEEHPDCGKSDSKYSDQYNKIIVESMGGAGDNDIEKEDKIIKNIAKEVIIEK